MFRKISAGCFAQYESGTVCGDTGDVMRLSYDRATRPMRMGDSLRLTHPIGA